MRELHGHTDRRAAGRIGRAGPRRFHRGRGRRCERLASRGVRPLEQALELRSRDSHPAGRSRTRTEERGPQDERSGGIGRSIPSLCSVCRLPRPDGLDGSSWRGLFDDPKRLWKRAVYSQHPRTIPGVGPGMGYSMRTTRHRYTEWSGLDSPYKTVELYDYKESPIEWRNVANRPEYVSLVNGLAHMHREGWQGSLPPTELPTSSRA